MSNQIPSFKRICCVCRKLQPVTQMTRVVRVAGSFFVQADKRLNGRGAHICPGCLQSSNLQKSLNRSFKTALPESIYNQLSTISHNAKLK